MYLRIYTIQKKRLTMNYNIKCEWSWIFSEGLGKAYAIHLTGQPLHISTVRFASPFFYFADSITEDISPRPLHSYPVSTYDIYHNDFIPTRYWGRDWTPPPLKSFYADKLPRKSDKPVIVINNKYTIEWLRAPFNFLPEQTLHEFLTKFSDKYQIYYIRYNGTGFDAANGYWDDAHTFDDKYNDYEILKEFPDVITIYDVMKEQNITYNMAQLYMLGHAKHVLTVNGGNAILSAYFGEDVIMYGHPDCRSTGRGAWQSDSWLKLLSGANIFGYTNVNELIKTCEDRWLD